MGSVYKNLGGGGGQTNCIMGNSKIENAQLANPVDSLSRPYSGAVLGSGYSSIAVTMLPTVAAVTLKACLAWANGEVAHDADVHDVKLELYSVALKLE